MAMDDVEEDCGFKFRRVSKPTIQRSGIDVNSDLKMTTSTPSKFINSKQEKKDRRRRRSSFAVIASRANSRPSSISINLSQKLPAASVGTAEYHKHLMPDLPGPIKMRQLLLWAVQKVASTRQRTSAITEMAEGAVQALFSNKISTSWYQRPAENGKIPKTTGPKNQELADCIQLYERYTTK
jgi:hypothetical protein